MLNARHGGWDDARATEALALLRSLYDGKDRSFVAAWMSRGPGGMSKELDGRVAIVTGSGRNIGRAIALALAAAGAAVMVNARENRKEAESVAREIERAGGRALAVVADVADAGGRAEYGRRGGAAASAASTSWSTTRRCAASSRSTS